MARTQAADYEERRTAIVNAAATLFAREGFAGASVARLAEAMGASKSLVYHYYASKEDILFEVMDSHLRALDEAAMAVMARDLRPEAKLREITRRFMTLYAGAAARHKVLLNELGALPAARRTEVVGRQRRLIEAVEGLLVEIQPRLAGRKGARRPAAMLFFGMINWTHTWFDPAGLTSAEAVADLAADIALGGVAGLG